MARNNEDHKKSRKRPGRSGRTFGLVVASALAAAPLGCDDTTTAPLVVSMDAGTSEDATAGPDGTPDAGGAVDAAEEVPSGVRG
jgi:hypothetical protein